MSFRSKMLPMLVLAASMGLSACIAHVREPYGYYGGGHRYGYTRVYSEYPRRTYHHHRRHDDDDGARWRRGDRYRDNDRGHDRWDRRF